MKMDIPLVVLAGGFGTRIRPAIGDTPKILAPIGNRSLLHFQVENWLRLGVRKFIFILYYKSEAVRHELGNIQSSSAINFQVEFYIEPKPLGTGGGINAIVRDGGLKGDFLVINGDTWLDGGFDLITAEVSPALLLTKVDDVGRYGEVLLEDGGKILKFLEKQKDKRSPGLIYAGLSKLNTDLFDFEFLKTVSLEKDLFPRLVQANLARGTVFSGDFIDVGIPSDYQRYLDNIEPSLFLGR